MLSSYEPPLEAFDMQEVCGDPIPLVPLILKAHFVNNVTGEGVQSVKKTLYKLASGSLRQDVLNFPAFQMIGHEVPAVYVNIELLIRQLRNKFRSSRREGEQKPFYTIAELMDKLYSLSTDTVGSMVARLDFNGYYRERVRTQS